MLVSAEEIQQIYRLVLGRDADDSVYEYWMPKIREFQITTRQFVIMVLTSDEYRTTNFDIKIDRIQEDRALITQAEKLIGQIRSPKEAEEMLGFLQHEWFHSFTLTDGTRINGTKSIENLQIEFDEVFGPVDVRGRTVLDIGAWNGAFSLEAMRRGAAHVLSVDFYTWIDPRFRGFEKFLYVRKDSGFQNIDYRLMQVQDVSKRTVGAFDIVLCLGVLYHLREPLSIFDRLAEIAQECLVMETHLDPVNNVDYPAMRYYPGPELAGDSTNWWGPNQACVEALLRTSGFTEVQPRYHPMRPGRGIFHARK